MTIRAWRFWRVMEVDHAPQLWSWFVQCPWIGPQLKAHHSPSRDNEFGIYGLRAQIPHCGFQVQLAPPWLDARYLMVVGGWVHMWGKIVEHEAGYRAEYAMIESIDSRPMMTESFIKGSVTAPILAQLQRTYGVELI